MKLSEYPYVTVRIACSKCARRGQYRLARLADRYGSETDLLTLIHQLSADCKLREREGRSLNVYDRCGAFFPDLPVGRPPDEPATPKATLRIIR